jgi:phosphoglycolate phosphatase
MLDSLSGSNTMAVLTNKSEEYTLKILAGLRLDGYFKIIWGGDTSKQRKPDPGPLREIMGRLDFKPEATLMIGDGPNDILAARAAGVACLALGYGYTPRKELVRLQPDYYAATIPELAGILHERAAWQDA